MNLNQFLALIRLRFQLSLNQIRKGGVVNSVLVSIATVLIVLYVLSSFLGGIVIGAAWLKQLTLDRILGVWNGVVVGFLFIWCFHVMNRLQQSDAISIDKLLHLPMTFHGAFLLNFVSSFVNLTLLSVAPLMVGLAIAMPIARGLTSAIAIPLTLSFLFMVVAVTHLLRSWLAEKMENKRTRAILMGVLPLLFISLFVTLAKVSDSESMSEWLFQVPFGWLPSGVMQAESGNWISGTLGTLAMTVIGCGGLFFAYRASMRRFTGAAGGKRKTDTRPGKDWVDSSMFASVTWVSDPVAAIALVTMRNKGRAPEVLAAFVPAVAMAIFGSPYLIGMEGYIVPDWIVGSLQPLLITVALLGFPAFLFSTFSYDRDGFRAFILSPVPRKDILFGRNIGIGIPTVLMGWLTMVVLQCFIPVGPLWFLGSLISLPGCYLLLCIFGNAISVFFAIGLKRGSMTPVNARVIPVVILYLGVLVGPFVALLPTMVALLVSQLLEQLTSFPMGVLYTILATVFLIASWVTYRKTLVVLGEAMWRNESEILDIVAKIPE